MFFLSDEEIDEDEAFNSEDEAKYGGLLKKSHKKVFCPFEQNFKFSAVKYII